MARRVQAVAQPSPGVAARRRVALGLALAFLAYASWGLLSPVGKHLLDLGFQPFGLNAIRFSLAALVALACIGARGIRDTFRLLRRRDIWWFNLLANASLALFLVALERLAPAAATLGFYTAPLWTAIWARVRLGEHVGPWFIPASALLLGGGFLALFGWAAPTGVNGFGLLLAIGSGLVWAIYTVALRKEATDIPMRSLMGASFVVAAVFFDLLALILEGPRALWTVPSGGWAWIPLYVGVPTLASFVLFNAAVQRAPAGLANLFVGAELGFTILFSALLFNAHYTGVQLVGLAVVLVAVTGYLAVTSSAPPSQPSASIGRGGLP